MPLKTSVFIATSLDGFISRPDGSIDWLERANQSITPGEDCGYQAFISTVDVIIMGRNTFEQVVTFTPWPYKNIPLIILTRNPQALTIPPDLTSLISASSESPSALLSRLSDSGLKHAYIDGGLTIQSFLRAHLIDSLTITTTPVLLGSGKSLFGTLPADIELQHLSTKTFNFGFVQTTYSIPKNP